MITTQPEGIPVLMYEKDKVSKPNGQIPGSLIGGGY